MARSKGRGRRVGLAAAVLTVAAALAAIAAPAASAAPVLKVKATWAPTNLSPGGSGQLILVVRNVGDADAGPFTITDQLPAGVSASGFSGTGACSGITTVTCTFGDGLARRESHVTALIAEGYEERTFVNVDVAPDALGAVANLATVSGGGSAPDTDTDQVAIDPTPSGFGMVPGSFAVDLFDAQWPAGNPVRRAGSHPFEMRVDFDLNLRGSLGPGVESTPDGNVKTIETTLPRGLFGNPEATPKCTAAQFSLFITGNITECPADTQIGTIDLDLNDGGALQGTNFGKRIAVYNIEPPRGYSADFGFSVYGLVKGHILPVLDPAQGYAIKAITPQISELNFLRSAQATFWGVPADSAHDLFRGDPADATYGATLGAGPVKPFLTAPMDCGVPGAFSQRVQSWQEPDRFEPTETSPPDGITVTGCDDPRVRFEPEVRLQPTSRAASGPTGLDVHLEVPQKDDTVTDPTELYSGSDSDRAIATPPIKKAVVTLPAGMTLSTSAAQGLGNCTSAQIGLGTDSPVACPESSRFGSLVLHTPILPADAPMVGDIYIAKQNDNPFHNFLSMYFVIHDDERGLLIKLPGKIDLDPRTGQITTTFDDLPQFPITDMQLSFKSGVRAALVNPTTCGKKTIRAEFFSWADPGTPHVVTSDYEIAHKADGSPCVGDLAQRPFAPALSAGTLSPSAGTYSPFVLRLSRTDDDQEFSRLDTALPPGLLAKIAGVSECPEAAIAKAGSAARTGTEEQLFPSCPTSSRIGSTDVGTGVGQVLTYIPGRAYLAGPYRGAPLSIVVITPVLAGPYDLGVIAVRSAIHVDSSTARVSVATDPLPQIFEGIPVRIRDIRVKVDRPQTTLNPTSCEPMAVRARVTGTGGDLESSADDSAVELSDRFQAANCASLGFRPKLSFRLKGGTHRGDYPALTATLEARPGDANIARTAVTLPHSEFLAQEHIRTVCTRVQFAANACPPASAYGQVRATSPLFDEALQGPVYLRSSDHPLPDLVAVLDGKIRVVLVSRVDSVNQGIRNTFDVVPDAPVTKFTLSMQGGKKGLLVNSRNLCESPSRADVRMVGQNRKTARLRPKLATSCKRAKGQGKKHTQPGGKNR